MLPPLDLRGFQARTQMSPDDVSLVETSQPGFTAQRIRVWSSYVYGRLRKRYSVPFGQGFGVPDAQGTAPPVVKFTGVPLVGSLELVLFMVVAGLVGTAAFAWSIDGGNTKVSAISAVNVTAPGTGYVTPPTVLLGAPDLPWGTQATATATIGGGGVTGVVIVTPGSGYLHPPSVTFQGGGGAGAAASSALVPMQLVTSAATAIPGTGAAAVDPGGGQAYSVDNVYTSGSPVPEIVLGWITGLVTVDLYQRRGVNPQDPQIAIVIADRDRAMAEIKEAADTKEGLFDLPLNDDTGTESAIEFGGELGYSETSPYVGLDIQRELGRREDHRGRGSFGGG